MNKKLFSMALVLLHCTLSSAETSVWKVRKGESVFFLGGTCHLLHPSDFPLPPEFENAYRQSDVIVFETDIAKCVDSSVQQQLMVNAVYPDGSTVEQHLSTKTYGMLCDYCNANQISIDRLKQFKPSIIAFAITVIALAKMGVTNKGVDFHFYEQAKKDQKPIETLETISQQINFILEAGKGNEDAFMVHTIKEMENIQHQYKHLIMAWKKGDVKKINAMLIADLKSKTPGLYKDLLKDRNTQWLPTIESYLQPSRKAFILVGVGHLVGPDGLLEALKSKGCKIEKR